MTKSQAIVIGINHYHHHKGLKYAVRDAELVNNFLRNHTQFTAEDIIYCLGDEKHQNTPDYPTYSNLLELLDRRLHPNQIGSVDRFWFFFAGHGESRNGRDYLLTSDSYLGDIDLKIALPVEEVIACLRRHKDADIVLILDNCRELAGSRQIGGATSETTAKLAHERGITTIFACDYGQFSYELDSKQHGSFTYALIEGLKQHTLPNLLEGYLQRRVRELNYQDGIHREQTPRIRIEPVSKVFDPLLPGCATELDTTELKKLATQAELQDDYEKAKDLWWQVINASPARMSADAKAAIDRIDEKITRLRVVKSESSGRTDLGRSPNEKQKTRTQPEFITKPEFEEIQQHIQALEEIIEDAKSGNNFANVRKRFLQSKKGITDFFSRPSAAVRKEYLLALVMIAPHGSTDTARLLSEATQIRNYLDTLAQKLN